MRDPQISSKRERQGLQVLTVYAPREGVGATVTAVNLAIELTRRGRRCALLDWDINGCGAFDQHGGLWPCGGADGKPLRDFFGFAEYVGTFIDSKYRLLPKLKDSYVMLCRPLPGIEIHVMAPSAPDSPALRSLHYFDWNRLYRVGTTSLFELLLFQLESELKIDTVIVDGVAGESPLALIATHQIADGVVMLTTLDPRERRIATAHCKTMARLPEPPWMLGCLSMVPGVAPDYLPAKNQWQWMEEVSRSLRPVGRAFRQLGLPYRTAFPLGQSIIVGEPDPFALRAPYAALAEEVLSCLTPAKTADQRPSPPGRRPGSKPMSGAGKRATR